MREKGFTLIELLAVIVVLAIIALIAIPIVLNTIEESKKGAASSSVYTYINEVETKLATYMLKNGGVSYNTGKHTVSELQEDLKIEVKGDTPSVGNICIGEKGTVTKASLKINNYVVSYDGREATTTDLEEIEDITCDTTSEVATPLKVGDYVSMTPTSTSYTIPASLTGYTSDQTIDPSELNIWRVISINENGTVDMVSEYVSSTQVYFSGQTGYKNFVGALNTIAKQYENSNYTVGSRHIGYNGQTEYLTDTANTVDSKNTTAPWASNASDNSNEAQGGGDTLYEEDTNLVTAVVGKLKAYIVGTTTLANYWLASRYYFYYNSSNAWYYRPRSVSISGSVSYNYLYCYKSGFNTNSISYAVRPIVTLKSGIQATGSGTSEDPWILE